MNPLFYFGGLGVAALGLYMLFKGAATITKPVRQARDNIEKVYADAAFIKNYTEGDSMFALADEWRTAKPLFYQPALHGGQVINPRGGRSYFDASGGHANMILELQTRLLELAVKHGRNDINPGRPDGSLGKQTAWAINRFQMSCAQPAVLAEGAGFRVGPATARALKFGGRVDPRALVSS